ncbi:MAG: DUF357 domain-containing protein [Nanoarchaeota archaeon]|nr:DUF357 domain-containing protein [Nanoarchaeota archaeon]
MGAKQELKEQITKHTLVMNNVFKNIRLLMKEEQFKELYNLALAYFEDSRHFYNKDLYVQSFEALIISWAYIDAGLKLDVFELTDDKLKEYFTND